MAATRDACGEQQWLFYSSALGIPVVLAWLRSRREFGLLLPLAIYHFGVVGFSLFDFQWYGDYFLVLQSAAFFLAALWVAVYRAFSSRVDKKPAARTLVALAACALATGMARPGLLRPEVELRRVKPRNQDATLGDQREVADALRARIGDGRVAFLENSEMLFLMRKRNEPPVIFWNRPTWSTYRLPDESIVEAAGRILVEADADFAVVPRPRDLRVVQPGTGRIAVQRVDYSAALDGYAIETFRSRNGRFKVELGVRTRSASGDEAPSLDMERIEHLRALGYASVGEALPEGAAVGLLQHDRGRAVAGLTLYTDAKACSTQLIDMEGERLHSWMTAPCYRRDNTVLLPDGDLLVTTREKQGSNPSESDAARYLLRLAWDGTLRWRRQLRVHHDVDWTPRDQILVLTHSFRQLPAVDPGVPVRDHLLTLVTPNGETLQQVSLWDAIAAAHEPISLQPVRPRKFVGSFEIDLFHSNSVEWMRQPELVGTHPIYREDSVLVCMRNQDLLLILDWSEERVIWSWGPDELSGPHDATLLPSGNILAFDNGLGRDWSRVVELDPRTNRIVWEYRASTPQDFYSRSRGASQRLDNGNTLITESGKGRIFEVTPQGEVVWEFLNPNLSEDREPGVVVRARRLVGLDFAEVLRRVESGEALPLVD